VEKVLAMEALPLATYRDAAGTRGKRVKELD
jgi:hypothetical protein